MKLMTLAMTTLMLATGSATGQVDVWAPGWPDPAGHRLGTDAWARQTDFATVSGRMYVSVPAPLDDVQFGRLLPPPLLPGGADPMPLPPPPSGVGESLAGDIAVTTNGLNGFIDVSQVPEPSALLMMLAGIGAIIFVIRRRGSED